MKLTGDLFFEDNGSMRIIPEGTKITEWHDSPEPPDDYMPEPDDDDRERAFAKIVEGEISIGGQSMVLTGYFDPQSNKAIIGNDAVYDGELVKSLEHAINWYNSVGIEVAKKHNIKTPLFGISGPDENQDYYAVVADSNDIEKIYKTGPAGSISDAYDLYITTAREIAEEIAGDHMESPEPDYEQMIKDREDEERDRNSLY